MILLIICPLYRNEQVGNSNSLRFTRCSSRATKSPSAQSNDGVLLPCPSSSPSCSATAFCTVLNSSSSASPSKQGLTWASILIETTDVGNAKKSNGTIGRVNHNPSIPPADISVLKWVRFVSLESDRARQRISRGSGE